MGAYGGPHTPGPCFWDLMGHWPIKSIFQIYPWICNSNDFDNNFKGNNHDWYRISIGLYNQIDKVIQLIKIIKIKLMFCVHSIEGKIQSARSETDMSKVGLGTTPRTRTGTTGTVASARALYNGLSRGASAKPTVTPRGVSMESLYPPQRS